MTTMIDIAKTLARSSTVNHPSGLSFQTPLLVPSFSSKGFRVTKDGSEVREALKFTSEWLTDTMLISAYDLAHGHIPSPESMDVTPELIIVDSGGYETRIEHDWSTAVHWPHQPLPWNKKRLRAELDRWPDRFAASFVSFDAPSSKVPVPQQAKLASEFFEPYPRQLHTFLLKPETTDQTYLNHAINSVVDSPHLLASFQFIGVTEKELGASFLDRMHNIAKLRMALDAANIRAPIHVFGALDPLTCVLLFLAGAEVFDGLTWLRYAFHDGVCVYQANYGALTVGTDQRDSLVRARVLTDNVHYLKRLSTQMQKFLLDRDFNKFEHHSDFIASEYDALRARLQRQGGA